MTDPTTPTGWNPARTGADPYIDAPQEQQGTTEAVRQQVGDEASTVAHTAASEAGALKDTALSAGASVADTAKTEVREVASAAKDQLRTLTDTARDELRSRAWDTHSFATDNVRTLSDELSRVLRGEQTQGPVNQLAQSLSSKGESLSTWLDSHDPEDVLDEVRRFAARRPIAFVALAAGAGLLIGRLGRGAKDAASDAPALGSRQFDDGGLAARQFYAQRREYDAQRREQLAPPVGDDVPGGFQR